MLITLEESLTLLPFFSPVGQDEMAWDWFYSWKYFWIWSAKYDYALCYNCLECLHTPSTEINRKYLKGKISCVCGTCISYFLTKILGWGGVLIVIFSHRYFCAHIQSQAVKQDPFDNRDNSTESLQNLHRDLNMDNFSPMTCFVMSHWKGKDV